MRKTSFARPPWIGVKNNQSTSLGPVGDGRSPVFAQVTKPFGLPFCEAARKSKDGLIPTPVMGLVTKTCCPRTAGDAPRVFIKSVVVKKLEEFHRVNTSLLIAEKKGEL